jgi:hypothetical protein
MQKINSGPMPLASSTASQKDLETARRLIVLVPAEADYTAATRRVWELAHALTCDVLFLTLCSDEAQESYLRRQLITMSAMVQDGILSAEGRVEPGSNWVHAVEAHVQQGDIVVCFAEQRAGIRRRPLNQILQARLDVPIFILSGLYSPKALATGWLTQASGWAGSIGIILASTFLQIRITTLPADWVQSTLLIFTVIGEMWLIWGWNNLFS